jgi:membrane protease YdiL (CAAX protease family)
MEPGPGILRQPESARFSVWHAFGVFLLGVIGGIVGSSIGLAISGDEIDDPGWLTTLCGFAGQFGTFVLGLHYVSRRYGTGSWRTDYGFTVRPSDGWTFFAGLGLQIALGIALLPLIDLVDDQKQQVVEELNNASGVEVAVLALFAALVAPVLEEVLFRGLLLRALLRRVRPAIAIAISSVAFGVVHLLLDPSLGTLVVTPGLIVMGVFSAILAVRSGDLSRSILFHVGFNFLAIVAAFGLVALR